MFSRKSALVTKPMSLFFGLREPQAEEASDKKKEDCDTVQDLLHAISCDNVSVNNIVRLGPPKSGEDSQPRPLKVDLASEDARNRVLKHAKNLKGLAAVTWRNVFIHKDLTPKEREARRKVVQELKTRRADGKTNLIIVNGRIVVKRSLEY